MSQTIATAAAASLATPLGEVVVDRGAVDDARESLPTLVAVDDAAHARDHSLQTQLPFLQVALDQFSVAPFLVASTDDAGLAQLVKAFAQSPDALVVVSSDLSHYLDYQSCRRADRMTTDAIAARDAASIGQEQACGYAAIRGLIHAARRMDWRARLLALQNSGDAAGSRSRVVGYGALAMEALRH